MNNFEATINSAKPTLVDFSAAWCGPCKMMEPILKELKTMVGEDATILKVDVDQNPDVSIQYQIRSVPTIMIFKNGQPVFRQSGVMQANQLKTLIDSHI